MAIDQAPTDKMLKKDDAKTKDEPVQNEYFVPEAHKTVLATSPQEALAKVKALSDNK